MASAGTWQKQQACCRQSQGSTKLVQTRRAFQPGQVRSRQRRERSQNEEHAEQAPRETGLPGRLRARLTHRCLASAIERPLAAVHRHSLRPHARSARSSLVAQASCGPFMRASQGLRAGVPTLLTPRALSRTRSLPISRPPCAPVDAAHAAPPALSAYVRERCFRGPNHVIAQGDGLRPDGGLADFVPRWRLKRAQ